MAASAGGMNLTDIVNHFGVEIREVKEIETRALEKLRTSFSDDYMGAYLDNDHTEEVSLENSLYQANKFGICYSR